MQYIFTIKTWYFNQSRNDDKHNCWNCGKKLQIGSVVVTRKTSKGHLKIRCYDCAKKLGIV